MHCIDCLQFECVVLSFLSRPLVCRQFDNSASTYYLVNAISNFTHHVKPVILLPDLMSFKIVPADVQGCGCGCGW